MSRARFAFTLSLLAGLSALVAPTFALGRVSGFLPRWVLVPTLLLVALQLLLDARSKRTDRKSGKSLWSIWLWVAAAPVLVDLLGFVVGGPLFVALYLKVRSRERWSVAAIAALAMGLALFVVLELLVPAELPAGRFFGSS